MKNRVLWGLIVFVLCTYVQSYAATYYSFQAGNFEDINSWSTSPTPPRVAPGSLPSAADIINISHAIVLNSTSSFTQWGAGPSITINTGGSLKRTGDFSLTGSGINIITNGGTFEVTGILTIGNSSKVTMQSGSIVTLKLGSLIVDDSSTGLLYTAGTMTLTGSLSVNNTSNFGYTPTLAIPGNLVVKNGFTVNASSVAGSITLTNTSTTLNLSTSTSPTSISIASGSQLNLTVSGSISPSSITIANANTEFKLLGGTVNSSSALTVSNSSKLTINAGTLNLTNSLSINGGIFSSLSGSTVNATSLTVSNSGSTQFTNGGTFNVTGSGSVDASGTILNNGTMNVGGDYNVGGGGSSVTTNNGTMTISGSLDLPSSSKFYTNPGGYTTVVQNVTTRANENLVVGTNVNPPPYADFVIKGNLNSQGSGDILVDKNGRLAVFGNFASTGGGGSIFTVNDGGQVYVNGTVTFNGGGDHLTNNNDGLPLEGGTPHYGFYSPNQPVYNGGGGSSNGSAASNSVTGISNIPSNFYAMITAVPGNPLTPMPVTLTYFKVNSISTEGVSFAWATATELNFDHFNLQRSVDGKHFETITTVQGHGTTKEEHTYSFVDKFPISGTSYYRLQSIDFDDYTETFNVVSVNFESGKTAVLYPIPVTDSNLSIKLNFVPAKEVFVVITDLSGLEVLRADVQAGETDISLPISVNPGFYIVRINSTEIHKVVKILVK